jgi:circadian clock protein KaiB
LRRWRGRCFYLRRIARRREIIRPDEPRAHTASPLPYCDAQPGRCTVIEPVLRLYVAGTSATARRAEKQLVDIRALIKSEWKVEVIDVLEKPELAEKAGILATPTLAYEHPERSRRIVGDLGDTKRVLEFLGIELKGKSA